MMKKLLAVLLTAAMLLSMVAVTASAAETKFPDVEEGKWYTASIERWVENGVVHGTDTGVFQPGRKMTRAEFAMVLCQLLKISDPGNASFSDLKGHWGANAMLTLANAGIMAGVGGGKANPNGEITREQAFALLARALHIPESTSSDKLPGVSDWAQGAVKALTERGIVKGTVAGTGSVQLDPQNKIDRASMMSLLDRTVTTYANKPGSYENKAENGVVLVVTDGDVTVTGEAAAVVVPSAGEGANVTLDKAVVTEGVTVDAPEVGLTVSGSKVDGGVTLTENADKANVEVASGSSVDTVTTAANEVTVSGAGEVKNVEVTGGDKVDVTTAGTNVKVDEAAKDATVTAGGAEVKPGEDTTIGGSGTGYEEEPAPTPTTPVNPNPGPGGDDPTTEEKVSVSYELNGASGTAPTQADVVKNGSFEVAAATEDIIKTGYTFAGWSDGTGTYQAGDTYNVGTTNVTLTAQWNLVNYNITYETNDGTLSGTYAQTYNVESGSIALPTPTKANNTFDGWCLDEGLTDTPVKTFVVTASTTGHKKFYAKWTADEEPDPSTTVTITYDAGDGAPATQTKDITSGAVIPAPETTPTKAGWHIEGWYTDLSDSSTKVTFGTTTASTATTIHAKWEQDAADSFTVKYVAADATSGTVPAQETVTVGTENVAVKPGTGLAKKGYKFKEWTTTDVTVTDGKFTMPNKDVTFTIAWQPITYTVKFNLKDGTGTAADITNAKYDEAITLPTASGITKPGYTLAGWDTAEAGKTVVHAKDSTTVKELSTTDGATVTLYAVWTADAAYVVQPKAAILGDTHNQIAQNDLYDAPPTVSNATGTGDSADVITSTITVNGLKSHWNNADPQAPGYWVGIALVTPDNSANDGITITGLKRGKGADKATALTKLSAYTTKNGQNQDELCLEGNVTSDGKTGYTLYVDASKLSADGTWVAVQWLQGAATDPANATPVGPITYYNIKANVTTVENKATLFPARLHDTSSSSPIPDGAGSLYTSHEIVQGGTTLAFSNSMTGISEYTVGANNVVEVTIKTVGVKEHQNGDDPANQGNWTGIAFVAPTGADGVKTAYADDGTKQFSELSSIETATTWVAEDGLVDVADTTTGTATGYAQYYNLTDTKISNGDWMGIMWTKNGVAMGAPIWYHVTFTGSTRGE